ncbi:MFS transporter [Sphingomonas sp.]|uniref:MFS transporter n=1 Tax=Sphingomonas sp. TaxID=28214 RepID=UPI000DB3AA12|nr:MFS transporter [Sphingomonas sp.]PZU06749.1 MAG: hypothetical protein DI605_18160 [Sphingomonas sp.]
MGSVGSETAPLHGKSEIFSAFDDAATVSPFRRRAMIMVALGEYLDGYDLIAIAGALLQLNSQFALTPSQTGLLGAAAFFGAAVGLLGAGSIADRIGRRRIFVHNFWLFAVLALISAFITGFGQLFVIRFLLGVAIGADIAISIPFLAEIAPRKSRGKWAGALPQIAWTLGAISSLAVAMALIATVGDQAWRWLFGLGTVPALIILAGRHGIPESPHWLLSQGRYAEAEEAMRAFGMDVSASANVPPVSTDTAAPAQVAKSHGSFLDIFRAPYTRKAWLVMIVLGVGPLVGTAASVAAPYVFRFVGLMGPSAALSGSILIWVGGLVGSLIALVTVERMGRILSSAIAFFGMAICIIALILSINLPALFVTAYVLFGVCVWFGSSSNWLLPTELLPAHLRARAQGVGSGLSRVSGGITTWFIPTSIAAIGFAPTFSILAVMGAGLGVFILAHLSYETKGISLEI